MATTTTLSSHYQHLHRHHHHHHHFRRRRCHRHHCHDQHVEHVFNNSTTTQARSHHTHTLILNEREQERITSARENATERPQITRDARGAETIP